MEEQHHLFTNEQRVEIKDLVHDALTEYFSSKGKMTKNILVGMAIVIGSLTVIFGGFKTLLAWAGFTYLGK